MPVLFNYVSHARNSRMTSGLCSIKKRLIHLAPSHLHTCGFKTFFSLVPKKEGLLPTVFFFFFFLRKQYSLLVDALGR